MTSQVQILLLRPGPLESVNGTELTQLTERWKTEGLNFTDVFCSPETEAVDIASLVAQSFSIPYHITPHWRGGQPLEGVIQIHERAQSCLYDLIKRGEGSFLVVAPGDILNAALRSLSNALPSIDGGGLQFQLGPLGYARAIYWVDRSFWIIQELHL